MTGHIIAVLDIGQATRITSGDLVIGCIGTVRKSGDVVITSCVDTDKRDNVSAAAGHPGDRHFFRS
jgi:hypothetical protein